MDDTFQGLLAGIVGWTCVYLLVNFLGYLIWGNSLLKGYTMRSFAVGIVHEGLFLPIAFAMAYHTLEDGVSWIEWLEKPILETQFEWHIHLMLVGYLLADLCNYPFSPGFDVSLLAHHVLSGSLAVVGLFAGRGAGYGAACIVGPELGSLWINICDIHPTRAAYYHRFFWYTLSRILAMVAGICYVVVNDVLWTRVFTAVLMTGVLGHNFHVSWKMWCKLPKHDAAEKKSS